MAGPGASQELARWREAREGWQGEPQREVGVVVDGSGVRRELERSLPSLGAEAATGQRALDDSQREEWSLRERKVRDEKAAAAQGRLPKTYYERQEQGRQWAKSRQ